MLQLVPSAVAAEAHTALGCFDSQDFLRLWILTNNAAIFVTPLFCLCFDLFCDFTITKTSEELNDTESDNC